MLHLLLLSLIEMLILNYSIMLRFMTYENLKKNKPVFVKRIEERKTNVFYSRKIRPRL